MTAERERAEPVDAGGRAAAEIRRSLPADAGPLSALIRRCLREVNIRDSSPEIIEGMCAHYSPATIQHLAAERDMFAATHDGEVMGTVSRQRNLVFTLYVSPDFTGHGTGRALMAHVEQLAANDGYTFMETCASIRAHGFYRRLGYIDVRETMTSLAGLNYILRKALRPMSREVLLTAPLPA
jgi:GNAT superfamily N-acetyltransferase